jgi:hypothetical protein
MSRNLFYEKYDILSDPLCNPTFDEILAMSQDDFRGWLTHFRKEVVKAWDDRGQPPRVGYDKNGIIENFKEMIKTYSLVGMETTDELTGKKDVIRNTSTAGNAVNQWFPTMMKTRITYGTEVSESRSIYDYFARDDLYETFVTYATRHFKRDSFYHYSIPVSVGDKIPGTSALAKTVEQFIDAFDQTNPTIDWFLCPVKDDKEYTGFNTELKNKKNLTIEESDLKPLLDSIPDGCKTNVDFSRWNTYTIRMYEKGQRLFPVGLKAFRISFCQYAVNFPPLTARYLYERYTKPADFSGGDTLPSIIYDPSAGWGGRLLGAMSVDSGRVIHYVGTDPNMDHVASDGWTKYQDFASFFNHNIREGGLLGNHGHSFHMFQCGSEVIKHNPDFQIYKGKVDLVFTSPPYFAKEVYSEDAGQSCHKFSKYEAWRDGFLKPTLETAVEWLKPGGYVLWNIADAFFGKEMLPLEKDSCDILKSLGMEYVETLKMSLAQMPGGNRLEETGEQEDVIEHTVFETTTKKVPVMTGKMKNFCKVKKESGRGTMFLKFEPIFVFRRPFANESQ